MSSHTITTNVSPVSTTVNAQALYLMQHCVHCDLPYEEYVGHANRLGQYTLSREAFDQYNADLYAAMAADQQMEA